MKSLIVAAVCLSACSLIPKSSQFCTDAQYDLYASAGLPWFECEKDKRAFMEASEPSPTLEAEFEDVARLRSIAKHRGWVIHVTREKT